MYLSYLTVSMVTFSELSKKFGYGYMSPYKIVFDGRKFNHTVESEKYFNAMEGVINSLVGLFGGFYFCVSLKVGNEFLNSRISALVAPTTPP